MNYFVTISGDVQYVQRDPRLNKTSNRRIVFKDLDVIFSHHEFQVIHLKYST